MNAPRALELNPGEKRVFRVLFHKDQKPNPQPNPVKARKGKKSSEPITLKPYKGQGKLGAPLKLKPYEAPPYATETEIRRRVAMIDDHLLARYPQIMNDLVPWLAAKAEGGGEVDSDDIEDFLNRVLDVGDDDEFGSSSIVEALIKEKILFEGTSAGETHLAGPGVGKPPPFTTSEAGARWALINVGADPDRDEPLIRHLDEMPLDEDGEIDASELTDFLTDKEKGLFNEEGEFIPDDIGELLDNLVRANVILQGSSSNTYYYDASISGRSDPYVVAHLKKRLESSKQQGKSTGYLNYLRRQISDREKKIGHVGHFDDPPAGRPKVKDYKKVPRAHAYRSDARPVQDILPGDLVYEMGPVPYYATKVVSVEKGKGDFYIVTVQDGAGKQFSKRKKAGSLIAIEKEVAEKVVEPKYHPAARLKIDDPQLLHLLSYFEGVEWMYKQSRFPKCQKCYYANKQAWEVLKSMGSRAKGLTVSMLLEGGGRIQGADHTKHWYQIDADGFVNIEGDTATDSTRKAMQEVGIDSV